MEKGGRNVMFILLSCERDKEMKAIIFTRTDIGIHSDTSGLCGVFFSYPEGRDGVTGQLSTKTTHN